MGMRQHALARNGIQSVRAVEVGPNQSTRLRNSIYVAEEVNPHEKISTDGLHGLKGERARERAYEQVEENIPSLEKITRAAATALGVEMSVRPVNKATSDGADPREIGKPIKKRVRVDANVNSDYDGDYSRCIDLIGTTLVMPDTGDYKDAIKKLTKAAVAQGASIAKVKFLNMKPDAKGYRDIKVSIRFPNGGIGEVIVVEDYINHAKFKRGGHEVYEISRILDKYTTEKGNTEIDKVSNLFDKLTDAIYERGETAPTAESFESIKASASSSLTRLLGNLSSSLSSKDIKELKDLSSKLHLAKPPSVDSYATPALSFIQNDISTSSSVLSNKGNVHQTKGKVKLGDIMFRRDTGKHSIQDEFNSLKVDVSSKTMKNLSKSDRDERVYVSLDGIKRGGGQVRINVTQRGGRLLSDKERIAIRELDSVSKALGVHFVVYDSDHAPRDVVSSSADAMGAYDPRTRTVYLDIEKHRANGNGAAILFTASHELTHLIRTQSSSSYENLKEFVSNALHENGVSVDDEIRKVQDLYRENGLSLDEDAAMEEVVANALESILVSKNMVSKIEKLVQTDKHLVEQFVEYIRNLFNALRGMVANTSLGKDFQAMLKKDIKLLSRVQNAFAMALQNSIGNTGVGWCGNENIRYAINEKRKEQMRKELKTKLSTATDEQVENIIAEIEAMGERSKKGGDTKIEKTAFHWAKEGTIILPEDESKVLQAIKVATLAKVDPMQYKSPMELINVHADIKPKDPPIDPDTVPQLSNKRVLPYGITIYDVKNTKDGQMAMRKIINTHFGKAASPWCLLAGDGEGGLAVSAWRFWNKYNAHTKRVAFRDGKLFAFSADYNGNTNDCTWWNRNDEPFDGVPIEQKIPQDKLGRTAIYLVKTDTGELTGPVKIYKGNRRNGLFEEWYENGQISKRMYSTNGLLDGLYETWHKNGQAAERIHYTNGEYNGLYEAWYENGQIERRRHFNNGRLYGMNERWYEDGQIAERMEHQQNTWTTECWSRGGRNYSKEYRQDGVSYRVEEVRYENGQLEGIFKYQNNKLDGVCEEWHENGKLKTRTNYKKDKKEGLMEIWDENGTLRRRTNYKKGKEDGVSERWDKNGILKYRELYKNGAFVKGLPIDEGVSIHEKTAHDIVEVDNSGTKEYGNKQQKKEKDGKQTDNRGDSPQRGQDYRKPVSVAERISRLDNPTPFTMGSGGALRSDVQAIDNGEGLQQQVSNSERVGGYGADVISKIGDDLQRAYEARGEKFPNNKLHQAIAQDFHKAISGALENNPNAWMVDVHSIEDYENDLCLLSEDCKAGVAVTPTGDIVSVFNYSQEHKGMLKVLLPMAMAVGGNKLDCYCVDDKRNLAKLYSQFGFKLANKIPFAEEYAPEAFHSWKANNLDRVPKYVGTMYFDGDVADVVANYKPSQVVDLDSVETIEDYDLALSARDEVLYSALESKQNLKQFTGDQKTQDGDGKLTMQKLKEGVHGKGMADTQNALKDSNGDTVMFRRETDPEILKRLENCECTYEYHIQIRYDACVRAREGGREAACGGMRARTPMQNRNVTALLGRSRDPFEDWMADWTSSKT